MLNYSYIEYYFKEYYSSMENFSQTTTYPIIVGGIIKQIRETKGFNQREMAEKMDLSQASWSKIESGKTPISITQLWQASQILGENTSQILSYVDEAIKNIGAQGIKVDTSSKTNKESSLAILGGAALTLFIIAALRKK